MAADGDRTLVKKSSVKVGDVKVGDYVSIPNTAVRGEVIDVYPGFDAEVNLIINVQATLDARMTVELIEVKSKDSETS